MLTGKQVILKILESCGLQFLCRAKALAKRFEPGKCAQVFLQPTEVLLDSQLNKASDTGQTGSKRSELAAEETYIDPAILKLESRPGLQGSCSLSIGRNAFGQLAKIPT